MIKSISIFICKTKESKLAYRFLYLPKFYKTIRTIFRKNHNTDDFTNK